MTDRRPETLPSTSVVIPTFNRRARLPRLMASLLDDAGAFEVLVVVDGCRDGSFELLEDLSRTERRLRPVFVENGGANRARFEGVRRAAGEVVVVLDDDVVAVPGLVEGHARHHAPRSHLVVLGYMPTVLPPNRRPGMFATYLNARDYELACMRYDADSSWILRGFVAGNMSLRRTDYLRVAGGGEELVDGYHADLDFGLRCLKSGLRGVFDRRLVARHEHTRSLDGFVRDAHSSGLSWLHVHSVHGDLLGPVSPAIYANRLPRLLRRLLRAARRPRIRKAAVRMLGFIVRAAGALRLFPLETRAAQLLRRLVSQHAAARFSRATGREPRPAG